MRLIQFQCGREGTLFYYQTAGNNTFRIVGYCPVCGSKRVKATGREYPPVEEAIAVEDIASAAAGYGMRGRWWTVTTCWLSALSWRAPAR